MGTLILQGSLGVFEGKNNVTDEWTSALHINDVKTIYS